MNEETQELVAQTLRDAKDFNMEIEVVCSMLLWMYGDRAKKYLNLWIVNACNNAKKEWDV